jgi:hypothetical protein
MEKTGNQGQDELCVTHRRGLILIGFASVLNVACTLECEQKTQKDVA